MSATVFPYSITANLPLIKCDEPDCGKHYVLIGVIPYQDDAYGEQMFHNFQQDRSYYCPYCGAKQQWFAVATEPLHPAALAASPEAGEK